MWVYGDWLVVMNDVIKVQWATQNAVIKQKGHSIKTTSTQQLVWSSQKVYANLHSNHNKVSQMSFLYIICAYHKIGSISLTMLAQLH